jgi:hypothetical protein
MEGILQRVDQLAAKLSQIAVEQGPNAIALAGKVYQYKAIGTLAAPFLLMFGLIVLWAAAMYTVSYGERNEKIEEYDAQHFRVGLSGIALFVAVIICGITIIVWTNAALWASAFDPNFALAAALLKAI